MNKLEEKININVMKTSFSSKFKSLNVVNDRIIKSVNLNILVDTDDYIDECTYFLDIIYRNFLKIDLVPVPFSNYITVDEFFKSESISFINSVKFSDIIKRYKNHRIDTFLIFLISHYYSVLKSRNIFSTKKCLNDLLIYNNDKDDIVKKCEKIYNYLTPKLSKRKIIKIIKKYNIEFKNVDNFYNFIEIVSNLKSIVKISIDLFVLDDFSFTFGKDYRKIDKEFPKIFSITNDNKFLVNLAYKIENIDPNHFLILKLTLMGIMNFYVMMNGMESMSNLNAISFEYDNNGDLFLKVSSRKNKNISNHIGMYIIHTLLPYLDDFLKNQSFYNLFASIFESEYNILKKNGIINNNYNLKEYLNSYSYEALYDIIYNISQNLKNIHYILIIGNNDQICEFYNKNSQYIDKQLLMTLDEDSMSYIKDTDVEV